jgi:sugar lactone lactonase YvrE
MKTTIRKNKATISVLGGIGILLIAALLVVPAYGWDRGVVTTFATLPQGSAHPEGITTDSKGNFYVVTWDYERAGKVGTLIPGKVGHLIVFAPDGKFIRRVEIAESSSQLGDISFHPESGNWLVVDSGFKQVLKVDPMTGASSVFISIPGEMIGSPSPRNTWAAPNGMTFDKKGNIYLTDSFQGTVWKTGPTGGTPTAWVKSDLLISHGFPSLGANGLTFNRDETALFVGNTGDDRIIIVPVVNGEAGEPKVFVNGVNGPDGMFVDEEDRLWVVANQADEIVVFDKTGKAIAKLGDFNGLDERGAPRGLLFPAEMTKVGDYLYVGNLAVDVRYYKGGPAVAISYKGVLQTMISQWAGEVKTYNIVRIPARIPPFPK